MILTTVDQDNLIIAMTIIEYRIFWGTCRLWTGVGEFCLQTEPEQRFLWTPEVCGEDRPADPAGASDTCWC